MHQATGEGAHIVHRLQSVDQIQQCIALGLWHARDVPALLKLGLASGIAQRVVGVANGGVDVFLPHPAVVEFDADLLRPQGIHVRVGVQADLHLAGQGMQSGVRQMLRGK